MVLNLVTQLLIDNVWTTYTSYEAEGWSCQIGPDVQSGLQPNRLEFALANPDLSMDPTNVVSPLYGKIGRNTAARIRIGGNTILAAEGSSWQPSRDLAHVADPDTGLSVVSVTAEGVQRRLGRWTDPIESALRRQIGSYASLLGYWPCEDKSGSSYLIQVVDGGRPGRYFGTVSLAADDGAGGSDSCLTIGSDGVLGGYFTGSATSGWQVCFSVKLRAVPSSLTYENVYVWTDNQGRVWYWRANSGGWQFAINDSSGTLITSSNVNYGTGIDVTTWLRCRMKVTVSGGTVTYEPAWYNQDFTSSYGTSGTFSSSTTGQLRSWQVNGNNWTDGAAYGHIFGVSSTSLDLINSYDVHAAFNGYLGETAGDRFYRLMAEQGLVDRYIDGDRSLSAPMGRQKPGLILDLLQECAVTDGGLLYDEPTVQDGLTLRLNNFLINRPVALALTFGVDVSPPLQKVVDDVNVANDVTGTNSDGTWFRRELIAGTLSTQRPPDGVGRYKQTLDLSLADPEEALRNRVGWELAQGTVDRPRYPSITVDLIRFPGYHVACTNMRPGDIISIDDLEPDTVYLRVMTIKRSGDGVQDSVTFECSPADVWLTGEYDQTDLRYDSGTSFLPLVEASADTALRIGTLDPTETWSTTSVPYDLMIAGERVTATVMGSSGGDILGTETFESSVQDFAISGGGQALSTAQAHGGVQSILVTVSGSPASTTCVKSQAAAPYVVPGEAYIYRLWVRSPTVQGDVRATVGWYDADGGFMSKSDDGSSLAANTWVQREVVATCPDGAKYARYGLLIGSSPANGTQVYIDDSRFFATSHTYQTATVTRAVNGVAKTLPPGSEVHIATPGRYSL